ncbi:DnaJ family domain-containing protein [uncultured Piscinibacter sp.]|uniref:DnaJ family domain-containing protein n=1 Tax=uncultured Piscinibacter sp. TaxID=1131835 RepID=UPI00261A499C|nr:DnaJ family domain-containing protein [uncultured Piscinibacter sp.]
MSPPGSPPDPSPDADARKRRDAAIRSQDEAIAEHLAQAFRSGELQSAPSFGKPMPESEGWAATPAEFRLPFKILKNAGVPPPEIELFHRRARLRERLSNAVSEQERQSLVAKLSEVEQVIALRLEGMRASGRL